MKTFKSYVIKENLNAVFEAELKGKDKDAAPVEPATEPDAEEEKPKDEEDSEVGQWVKVADGWIVRFLVGSTDYSLSFSPLDDAKRHWKFTYYKTGQRDSSDIRKFGDVRNWLGIWKNVVPVLKDFIRIFSPETVKYIGMSASKRPLYYKELFKLYVKNFVNAFRNLGYHASFDHKDYNKSPSFVIRKGAKKEPKEVQAEAEWNYRPVNITPDRKISKAEWMKDGKNLHRYKVDFLNKDGESYTSREANFENPSDGLKWAKSAKEPQGPSDEYIKQFGTAAE